jgi:GT2 family glycosyltransferase/tetratricopeptide (TPR) repeat protein/SAM-dependent methyltransferase
MLRRIAIFFNNTERPETTGTHCKNDLDELVRQGRLDVVTHYLPTDIERVVPQRFDLFLVIDDGQPFELPDTFHPAAYWTIDTHMDFFPRLALARQCEFVFAAQQRGARELAEQGIAGVRWLPLAAAPTVHRKLDVAKRYDFAFVGNLFPGRRIEIVSLAQQYFRNSFVGRAYGDDMSRILSEARVGLNPSLADDVNMRFFEVPACGTFLLTNALAESGQAELLHPGKEFETFTSGAEMLDKLRFYVARDELREQIAAAGHAAVFARHTYLHRMSELLDAVEATSRNARPSGNGRQTTANGKPRMPSSERARAVDDQPPAHPSPFISHPSSGYFQHERPELLALAPPLVRRALDVGCGAGAFGASLKARQGCHVTGVEISPQAAKAARRALDEVHNADIESFDPTWTDGAFDLVCFGDSLEHMHDPQCVLEAARHWLADGGHVIASLPNCRHHSIVAGLIAGNWSPEPAGILDATHRHFLTRREIEKLFFRAGYDVCKIEPAYAPGSDSVRDASPPGEIHAGRLHQSELSESEEEEFHAYQYLVVAAPTHRPKRALTSIVVVTHNALEYTQPFVESVRFYTDGRAEFGTPYELIFVDNGSTDGTRAFLESQGDVTLIANDDNRGFPAAANQGLAASRGAQVLFINNDVLLVTGWLEHLLEALYSDDAASLDKPARRVADPPIDANTAATEHGATRCAGTPCPRSPQIGLVGPCTNFAGGPQQIAPGYASLAELDGWAWDHHKQHTGQLEATDRLVGFCLLVRREVFDQIGNFDERFGVGNFEDDDLCRRAVAAGWRCANARGAYIHHFGHRSFAASGIDLKGLLERNAQIYAEKWSSRIPVAEVARIPAPSADAPSQTVASSATSPYPLSPVNRPLLSCCMIVRNAETTIAAAVGSIRRWVGEVVVVDTGSTDRTVELCRELGAHVFHFPWCDSFSAARNESLKHARGVWLFWMDADDSIDEENGRKLQALAESDIPPEIMGFVMQVHCPGPGGDMSCGVTVVDHCKMFRNRRDVGFEGRVHEQVVSSIRRVGGEIAMTDIAVVHSGADYSPGGQRPKVRRDLRLLRLELRERPGHPFTLFNLGMTYAFAGKHRHAVKRLRQALAASDPRESTVRKIYSLLANSLRELGRIDEALPNCREGLTLYPKDPELRFREGVLLQDLGDLEGAERAYLAALANDDVPHFASIDRGVCGYIARHNLALIYVARGDQAAAEQQWQLAVADAPGHASGWLGLARALLAQGKLPEAQEAFRELLCLDPADASSHHNLGAVLYELGRYDESVRSLRTSLRLRPGSEATEMLLADARQAAGRQLVHC